MLVKRKVRLIHFFRNYSFQVNALEIFLVLVEGTLGGMSKSDKDSAHRSTHKQKSAVVNPALHGCFPSMTTVSGNEIKMEGMIHMTGGEH